MARRRKSTIDTVRENTHHDELIATIAAASGAHPAEVYRLNTRSSYAFHWRVVISFAVASIFLPPIFIIAIPSLIAIAKRRKTLKELRNKSTEPKKKA